MGADARRTIRYGGDALTYDAAESIAREAMAASSNVLVDLHQARQATVAGMARLVALRKELLRQGRDLCVTPPVGQAGQIYEVCRFQSLLPLG